MTLLLGRKPRSFNPAVPHLSALLAGKTLQPVPHAIDNLARMPDNLGAMLNDSLGDCTCAGLGHAIQVWTDAEGNMVTIPDQDVEQLYEGACGFDPNNPNATDNGGVEQDVLTYALKTGIPTPNGPSKISAFVEIDPRNIGDVKRGIADCGLVYIGFNVPGYLMDSGPPELWDVSASGDQSIVGGHCVILPAYTHDDVFGLISWGSKYQMTLPFWHKYVDECYAIADEFWLSSTGTDPFGMTLAQLEAQMKAIQQ